jgi:putative membrane protein
MYYGVGHMGSIGLFGGIWMLLFWIAVIWLIIWLIRKGSDNSKPIDTLKTRYAKGEITKKQFDQMKKDLI